MLKRLRNAPYQTRQKWFVILSVVAGLLIAFLWVQYLGWSLQPTGSQAQANEVDEGFNPVSTLKGIGASVYDAIDASRPAKRRGKQQ